MTDITTSQGIEAFYRAIESTVRRNAAGRVLSTDAQSRLVQDILKAIGIDLDSDDIDWDRPVELVPVGPDAAVREAVRKLLEFAPDGGYSDRYARYVAESDWRDVEDPADVEGEAKFLRDPIAYRTEKAGDPVYETETLPSGRTRRRRLVPNDGPVPFLSQSIYYPILDKEDGRTLNGRIREVRRLLDLDDGGF